jgi:hypothetical protein
VRGLLRAVVLLMVFSATHVPAFAQRAGTERFQNRDVVSQEVIVRFRGAANAENISRSIRNQDPDITSSSPIGRSGAIRLRSQGRDVSALIQAYGRRPDVEYAEPNYVWHADDIPNDSFFGDQWALRNTGQTLVQAGVAGADIKAFQAWDVAEGSRGIVVGMIDSGIEYTHPDLVDNMWSAPSSFSVTIGGQTIQCAAGTHGFNAITRTCDPMDDDGHGTHTAGIVGARGNSGLGVAGISRVANLMALKFLDSTGQGTTANAIAAIEFAIQAKKKFPSAANVRILNASWGGGAFSQALLDEINLAAANDMLFVTSAGNLARNNDSNPQYPATYYAPNLIAVAATDNRDQLASFSNFGTSTVHLGAPGVEVLSTSRGKFYSRQSGTSASAPMVSGAAALVLSACPLDMASLRSNILDSVDPIPSLSGITVTGGRLNVNKAIRNCAGIAPATFTLGVSPPAQTIAFGTGNQFSISINPLNDFAGIVSLSASNLPAGMSIGFQPAELSTGSSILAVSVTPAVNQGTYLIGVSGTAGGVTRSAGIVVTVGLPSECSIDLGVGRRGGSLASTDAASIQRPPAFADFCTFTLDADRALDIEMSAGFNSPFIYLLSSSGQLLASGVTSGSTSKIVTELTAGSYTIEATSSNPGVVGLYDLYVRNTSPKITSISQTSGLAGSSVDITIRGTAFVGSPFLVKISSCVGVTVTNVTVINSTTATARLTLPGTVDTCAIGVSTPGGATSTLSFRIVPPPPIITGVSPALGMQGQTVSITLTGTNFVTPLTLVAYPASPPNSGVQFSPTTVTSTMITLTWNISPNTVPGQHRFRVQTEGGFSNDNITFTVLQSPPTITEIYPIGTGRGMFIDLDIHGTGFSDPIEINTGPEITVSNIKVMSFSNIHARFTAAADAAYADYPVTVKTALGTSNVKTFRVAPPPTITSFTPKRAFLGAEFSPRGTGILLTGTNFICGFGVTIDGTGVEASVGHCSETTAGISLSVSHNAPLGPRKITVTMMNGVADPIYVDIVPVPAFIREIIPPYGGQGLTSVITITGSGMTDGTVNVSGGGVTSTTLSSTNSSLTASLSISASKAIGLHELTVTTIKGVSDPVPFTITPPTWPDMTIVVDAPPFLGEGYDETYTVTVRNVGTKETTAPIKITDKIRNTEKFVSVNGSGWTCVAVNSLLTCTNPVSIAPNAETTFELVITAPVGISGTLRETTVSSPEDYNNSNNSVFLSRQVRSEPPINIKHNSQSLEPGQQGTVSLFLSSTFPHDIVDELSVMQMSFIPTTPGTPMDPAAQFATGGQKVSFIIKANTLVAEFQGVPGPLGFQTGTVAGSLMFTYTHKPRGGAIKNHGPYAVSVASRPPRITAVTASKILSGFDAAITMQSSTKNVSSLSFRFNTLRQIQLGCGGLQGCSVSGQTITFTVTSIFNTWYAGNTDYGSLATIRVPFNIDGTISGTVSVSLTNNLGMSNSMDFTIP